MLDSLPPELLSRVLEIAIETWGVGFLPPICLVSSACNSVVVSTPSLWGIIVVDRHSSLSLLDLQLAKAKETDLKVIFPHKGWQRNGEKHIRRFMASLNSLSHNWVRVELPTSLISSVRWADMRRVEILSLRYHGNPNIESDAAADKFFESNGACTHSNLHSFTSSGLPEQWVTRLLNPRISFFEISRLYDVPASTIQRYLSIVQSNIHTLNLLTITFLPFSASSTTTSLKKLHNLELTGIHNFAPLLLNTRVPGLRVLSIRNCTGQIGSVFSQWSQAGFIPSNLQSLELSHCLSEMDVPFLIGWLARLPALLRLIITLPDTRDPSSPAASVETDLIMALSSPDGAGPVVGGWLCPSLVHLCLDADLHIADILPIARMRGGATANSPGLLSKLRSMQVHLCASGNVDEVAEFRSCFAEPSDAGCLCLGCSFNLTI
ncbi:hypothetical protein C8R43DRAFT_345322 [Mycena crocata]|nr:hypothetical protein C8R43DRAFT_345322 [Mycena crocata]